MGDLSNGGRDGIQQVGQPERDPLGLKRLLRGADRISGLRDPMPPLALRAEYAEQVEDVWRKVNVGRFPATVATAREIRWLLRRTFTRGLETIPDEPRRAAWGGEARALVSGAIVDNRWRWLRVTLPGDGEFHVASLAFSRFPDSKLTLPGGEWLYLMEELPWPGEFSVRFRVLPHAEARKAVGQTVRKVMDQVRHIEEVPDAQVPLALRQTADEAQELQRAVERDHEPLLDAWPMLVLTATDEDELKRRVRTAIHHYHDELQIDLEWPTGDQLAMFMEAMPGGPARERDVYPQRMAVITLAGSGATASTSLGDGEGPYVGVTSLGGASVNFDPFRASRRNMPTLIGLFGRPGVGKSNLLYLLIFQARSRGASVTLVDPKAEAGGLAKLCEGLGTVNRVRMDLAEPGMLDPYRILVREEAPELASTILQGMLPPPQPGEVRAAVIAAASVVAGQERPTLSGVVERMLRDAETSVVRSAAQTLQHMSTWRTNRVLFSAGSVPDVSLRNALTLLQFQGLPLPESGLAPERWTDSQRCAVMIVHAMSAMAG